MFNPWAFWKSLSDRKKAARLGKVHEVVKKLALEQIADLQGRASDGHVEQYVAMFVREFWKTADFMVALRRGKWRVFGFYPARSLFESSLRFEHILQQPPEERRRFLARQFMSSVVNQYIVTDDLGERSKYASFYDLLNKTFSLSAPPIDAASKKPTPFPDFKKLLEDSSAYARVENGGDPVVWKERMYRVLYSSLSDRAHFGLQRAYLDASLDDLHAWIQSALMGFRAELEMLDLVDKYQGGIRTKQVQDVRDQAEKISFT